MHEDGMLEGMLKAGGGYGWWVGLGWAGGCAQCTWHAKQGAEDDSLKTKDRSRTGGHARIQGG